MYITKLILRDYERISQNGIHSIEIEFPKTLQIIIGSNGSGKSSILEQLSPLPPSSSDFGKNGYKEVHFTHKGSQYIAINDLASKTHYLEKDGEVLNNYGTGQVQKSLIEIHTGLTSDIFDILCNKKKFTELSPTLRRDWVMRLSRLELDPIMKVFQSSKERLRDAKAYMTKLADRIKILENDKADEQEVAELKSSIERLKLEYEYYSDLSSQVVEIANEDFQSRQLEIEILAKQHVDNSRHLPDSLAKFNINSFEDLQEVKFSLSSRKTYLEEQLDKQFKILEEQERIKKAKLELEELGEQKALASIANLEAQIEKHKAKLAQYNYSYEMVYVENAKTVWVDKYPNIIFYLDACVTGYNPLFKNEEWINVTKELNSIAENYNSVDASVKLISERISHYTEENMLICPECKHGFHQGISHDELRELNRKKVEQLEELAKLKERGIELKELVIERNNFVANLNALNNELKTYCKLTTQELTFLNGFDLYNLDDINRLKLWCEDRLNTLMIISDIHYLNEDILSTLAIIQKAKETRELIESNSSLLGHQEIDEVIFGIQEEIQQIGFELSACEEFYQHYISQQKLVNKIDEALVSLQRDFLQSLDNERANFIKQVRFDILKEINLAEIKLNEINTNLTIYKDNAAEYEKAKKDYNEYKLIVDNLSPNTGVIADVMNNTIDVFVDNLNRIIKAVWTSNLKVLPCINKKNDLDWRFPVVVDGNKVRSDVSETSTSQTDILNLAFQLTVAKFIGASDFPLYLDELGSSMDEQHRINMMQVVGDLVDAKQCSQLFLISHFAAFHEQFTNAEVLLLNDKNILNLPKEFNNFVTIN